MEHQVEQRAAEVSPAAEDMLRIWRADRCVQDSSAGLYLQWIKRFRTYCARHGLDERAELTLSGAQRFIASYVRLRGLDARRLGGATLRVVRPKTGVAFTLPFLPAVAKALAFYLRDGRPPNIPHRYVFVRMKMPFSPLSASSAVRHILVKHAKAAGLNAPYLGSHVLRHSNAARQVDLGSRGQPGASRRGRAAVPDRLSPAGPRFQR